MHEFLKGLLLTSLAGTAAALLLLVLRPVILRRLPRAAEYSAWMLIVLRLLVPLSLTVMVAWSLPAAAASRTTGTTTVRTTGQPADQPVPSSRAEQDVPADSQTTTTGPATTPAPLTPGEILTVIWGLGTAAVLVYNVAGYRRYRRSLRRTAQPVTDDTSLRLLEECRRTVHVRTAPALFTSSQVTGPVFLGSPGAAIVLPPGLPASDLRYALLHELTHARRHDDLMRWGMVLAVSMHWFNPIVYIIQRRFSRACELSCDESVTRLFSAADRHAYGTMLLSAATGSGLPTPVTCPAMIGTQQNIRERLTTILTARRPNRHTITVSILTVLLIAGTALLAGCTLATRQKGMQQPELLAQVRMVTRNDGWALSIDNQILHTSDGGATWKNVSTTAASTPGAWDQEHTNGACFLNAAQASMGIIRTSGNATSATIYTTTDGGRKWISAAIPPATDWEKDDTEGLFLDFADAQHGFILVTSSPGLGMMSKAFYATADGGRTFTFVKDITGYQDEQGRFFGIQGYPTGMAFSSATTGFVTCSYHGQADPQIYKTTDGGRTWGLASQEMPEGTATYQLTFPAGEKPLRKDTGTYIDAYSPMFTGTSRQDGTMLLSFADGLGNRHMRLYRTTDGGADWTPGAAIKDNLVQSCSFLDDKNGYGLDEKGNLFATVDGGADWTAVPTGRKVSLLLMTDQKANGYNAVPIAWNLDQRTLQGIPYPALGISNPDRAHPPVWSDGTCITLLNAGDTGKHNVISLLSVDTQLIVPTAKNAPATGICRWFAPGSNALVSVPLRLTPAASAKTLNGTTLSVTTDLTASARVKTLTVAVPSDLSSLNILYGSGDENDGFVLARGAAAKGDSESLWLLRMKKGTAAWEQCGTFSRGLFDSATTAGDRATDFARVGSLLYILRSGGRIACIDTASATPTVDWPAALNDLLTKLLQQGPQNAPSQIRLGSDGSVLLMTSPAADGTTAFTALDTSGTTLGSLHCTAAATGSSLTAYDAGGHVCASLPVLDASNAAWGIALPSVDLFQRIPAD